jgi:hypothetical protein
MSAVALIRTAMYLPSLIVMKEAHWKMLRPIIVFAGIFFAAIWLSGRSGSLGPAADSPSASKETLLRNVQIHASQLVPPPPVQEYPHVPMEGIEPAERINQEMLHRRREQWERLQDGQLPFAYPSAAKTPGNTGKGISIRPEPLHIR